MTTMDWFFKKITKLTNAKETNKIKKKTQIHKIRNERDIR